MARNIITIEVEVDPTGRIAAGFRNASGEVERFEQRTAQAGRSGSTLRDVFTGNLLADFFQRGAAAAVDFARTAVQASADAADANRVLKSSATQAGQSYGELATKAEDFGRKVGLSNTEAARSFAEITKLAGRAGIGGEADKLAQQFADVAAAQGLSSARMVEIARGIAAGTDDNALNAIGGRDPGALYAEYAKSAGKAADALTEVEKARARVSEVQRLAAPADGAAAERLNSVAGELDTARASYENLTTQVGDAITTSVTFKDTLDTIAGALDSLVVSHAEARRELAKGLKTPEQLAEEARGGDGRQTFNAFLGGISAPFSLGFTAYDQIQLATGQISREDYDTRIKGTTEAVFNPGQRQYDADVERFRKIQRELQEQDTKATQTAAATQAKTDAQTQATELATRQRTAFDARYTIASREDDPARRVALLRQLALEVRGLTSQTTGDVDKLAQKLDQDIFEAAKRQTAEIREQAKAAIGFITESAGRDNPFVNLFVQAGSAAERMQAQFGRLGQETVNQLTTMERAQLARQGLDLRFDSQLKALQLQQQAYSFLESGALELSRVEEARLSVLRAQVTAYKEIPTLLREASEYETGRRQSPQQRQREDREQYERIRNLRPVGDSAFARAGQAQIDDYTLQQTEGLSIDALRSADPFTRGLARDRAEALRGKAGRFEQDIRDAQANAQVAQQAVNNVFEQFNKVREIESQALAAGFDPSVVSAAADKNALKTLQGLQPSELTPELRRAGFEAAGRESQREAEKEQQAQQQFKQLFGENGIITRLSGLLGKEGMKVELTGEGALVTIKSETDKAKISDAQLGFRPGVEDRIALGQGRR